MFDDDEDDDWKVPNRKWPSRRAPVLLVAAAAVFGALVAVVLLSFRSVPVEPEPEAPPQTGLTAMEEKGVKAALGRFATGSHHVTGEVFSHGITVTVDLTYTADRVAGAGTVTAGTVTGEALLDADVVFLRGPAEFWNALRVAPLDTEEAENTWVAVDPRFMDGGLFQSSEAVAEALAPTLTAELTVDGRYRPSADSSESARMSSASTDVVEYSVAGVSVKVVPVDPVSVPSLSVPLLESRTVWATMAGDPDTSWRIIPPEDIAGTVNTEADTSTPGPG